MSGHSKWAKLKHSKPTTDAKKSKSFSKYSNIIATAAKQGGNPDPKLNPYLKEAIDKARQVNMPQDNIERAIKRGLGLIPGVVFEELMIEAFGPEGIALLIQAATDNKNRTIPGVRKILSDFGGSIAGSGSVQRLFQEFVKFELKKEHWFKNPGLELELIEAGAEEIFSEDDPVIVLCHKNSSGKLKKVFNNKSLDFESEMEYLPSNPVEVKNKEMAGKTNDLIEALESRDDVNAVYANANLEQS